MMDSRPASGWPAATQKQNWDSYSGVQFTSHCRDVSMDTMAMSSWSSSSALTISIAPLSWISSLTSGYNFLNFPNSNGSRQAPICSGTPRRIRFLVPTNPFKSRSNRSTSLKMSVTRSSTKSPSSVRYSLLFLRENRLTPSSRSSSWIAAVTLGWETCSSLAARVMLPRRQTCAKYSIWLIFTIHPSRGLIRPVNSKRESPRQSDGNSPLKMKDYAVFLAALKRLTSGMPIKITDRISRAQLSGLVTNTLREPSANTML